MASSNNSIAENNKKTKNPKTSTPTSKIKKEKSKEKKNEENNNKKNKKKLNFTNGNSKGKQVNGKKHHERNNDDEENEEEAKTHVFPMNRIRTILKGEISDMRVSQEAVLAINKAAEKFLEQLAQEAYVCSVQDRKKSLSYNHLSRVVSKQSRYDFLSDFVPEKVKAEDALRETNLRGNRGG
ncbi:DNA-directed DNA polymerase [Trifolium repens]|nr:nuclear factor Y, subunit C10 [Trifolium repens]WJX44186.1 DNA-directed DNA polymerase [Trifolium repens]